MFYYKLLLGILAVIIGIFSYIPYFRDLFAGKTKPHAFSWFVWAILTGIAFAAQINQHAGPGAWITGITALVCLIVSIISIIKGKRDFPLFDWLCLISSFFAIVLWWYTKNPTASVILITITDALAFLPTFRKSYHSPHEETAIMFAFASVKFALALVALQTYTIATYLYPASLVFMNGIFVAMLIIRRKQLKK